MELTSNMVLSGFKFSELSRYCWFLQPCHLWSSDCTFLQRAVLGKDPASPRPDAQRLMFDVFSFLLHSVGFMPLYTSWYFDPFWEGMCICMFCVVFPLFWRGMCLAVRMGIHDRDPCWVFYETSALCKHWAEHLSKSEPLDNSVTDVQYFVLHLLANTLINRPFGKKSSYKLVGNN